MVFMKTFWNKEAPHTIAFQFKKFFTYRTFLQVYFTKRWYTVVHNIMRIMIRKVLILGVCVFILPIANAIGPCQANIHF